MTSAPLARTAGSNARRRGSLEGGRGRRVLPYLFLGALIIYFLIPIWWLFVASTKNVTGLFDGSALV
jgi:multiple sugar transport system permease protein